jgi:mannosyltransferase
MTLLASSGASREPAPNVGAKGDDHRGRRGVWAAIVARREWLLPFALALMLGLWRLEVPALWRDERYTWSAATRSLDQLIATLGNSDIVFAPYYLFMHYWVALGGTAEWWLRLPSVVAVACMAAVTAILGRRLGVNGLAAGLIVAVLPITSRFAHEARVYAVTMLLAVVATLVLHWALERPQRIRWILYGVSVVCLAASHLVALSLLAAHAVFVALRHRRSLVAWVATCCVVLAAISPLVLLGFTQTSNVVEAHQVQDGSRVLIGAMQLVLFGAGPIFVVLFVGATGLGLLRRRDFGSDAVVLPALWIVSPLIVGLAVSPWVPVTGFVRYFLFVFPAWALLAARAIEGLPKWTTLGVGAVLLALLVPAHWSLRQGDGHGEDPRVLTEIIAAHSRPGDGIIYQWNSPNARVARTGMDYYLPPESRPLDVLLTVPAAERGSFVDEECTDIGSCLADTRRLWLVSTGELDSLEPEKAAVLTTEFRLVRTWESPAGEALQLWERR